MLARAAFLEAPSQTLRRVWPGWATCVLIALAASFVAALHQGPPMLYALLFGTAVHCQDPKDRTAAGVDFCSRTLLRLGVGLLGARITWDQVVGLGWPTVLVVLGAVATTLLCGWWGAKALRLPWTLGVLTGGATAICGASAALAIGAVLPRASDGDTPNERHALVVAVMATLLSTAAMLAFPPMAHYLELTPAAAGLFIGGSIHDVAQVVVAGYAISPAAGDAASLVKLLRVSLLVAVVLGVSIACNRPAAKHDPAQPRALRLGGLVPSFLWLFVALAALNSLGCLRPVQDPLNLGSRACLMLGVAGLGMKTSFRHLASAGWRPVLLMLATSTWLAAVTLAAACCLGLH
ncbi:putative integral membrane protein (TIGR00698 family) [Pelomonas saccharophila]|uniref:Integral membrane protein (TIGR00698 family) n=1 Tax=Roseateles saccharophilus TaxID=304 RepID=A0ABU1YH35_ROSSA|nr:putative sulfate exporter family transporter [Roseateles saccharophilus]MDR7268157.1 putative integral membrane protein (TIGR00698 family) [Roseateles saccharophilus]